MKNKTKIIIILIVLVVIFFAIVVIKNNPKYIVQDGMMLALTLDGNSTTSIPERGRFNIEIDCGDTADGKWLAEEWKLAVENISGNVKCNVSFTTKATTLKNKVENEDNVVVDAKVPSEDAVYTALSYNEYSNIANSSTYPFVWNEDSSNWIQSATESSSSYFKFYPNEEGAYQVCYTLPSSSYTSSAFSYNNYMRIYLNSTSIVSTLIYSNYNNQSDLKSCYDMGYLETKDYIYIEGHFYDNNTSFYIKKTTDLETFDVGYRYSGKKPNNWVWFNRERWRIIGSIPTKQIDGTTSNLVKIIRAEPIGDYAYDASSTTSTSVVAKWGSNTLYNLLNTHYYAEDTTSMNGQNHAGCYSTYNSSYQPKPNCDYTVIGILANSYYGKMIKKVYWNTGVSNMSNPSKVYAQEIKNQTVTGYIGLMNASDYGYSAVNTSKRAMASYSGRGHTLTGTSWLFYGDEWTSNQFNGSGKNYSALSVHHLGVLNNGGAHIGNAVRPVVYLDASVYVISGDGSVNNPYQIGM